MKEVCARYHLNSTSFSCEAYQAVHQTAFPACHPCKGCEKRDNESKNQVPLRLRQGGRHKTANLCPACGEVMTRKYSKALVCSCAYGQERIKELRKKGLDYYHAHKQLRGIKPQKERTSPKEIVCKGKCGMKKSASEFYRDVRCSNGHRPKCKVCEGAIRVENLRKQKNVSKRIED